MQLQLSPVPGELASPVRTATVLVVDDEEDVCATLRDVLEDEGFAVRTAGNGRDALAIMRQLAVKPRIVILDVMMPVLDGSAVYAEMKRDAELARVPVVICTSDPSRAPTGASIMRKPVVLDLLLATVRRCC